jgi:hypothetical protein
MGGLDNNIRLTKTCILSRFKLVFLIKIPIYDILNKLIFRSLDIFMKAVLIKIVNSCLLSKLNETAQIKNSGSKY